MTKPTLKIVFTAAIAAASLLVAPFSEATTLLQDPTEFRSISFTGNTVGQTVDVAYGWTGSGVANTVVANPGSTGYGGEGHVLSTSDAARQGVTGPALGLSAGWNDDEVVYLSAWFMRTTALNSGARLYLRDTSGTALIGLGITDGTSTPHAGGTSERGHFMFSGVGGAETIYYSAESAIENHWYEMTLVIKQDFTDPSLSLGYLYVRDATAGDTSFRLIEDIAGLTLGYTESIGLGNVDHWRIEMLRAGGQIGDLVLGTAIPEPSTVAMMLGGALLAGVRCFRKGRFARR